MIIQAFLDVLIPIVAFILSPFPVVTSLPFGLDSTFVIIGGLFRGAIETFPYLNVVWDTFLILMAFEIVLFVLKFFLGSHTPVNFS